MLTYYNVSTSYFLVTRRLLTARPSPITLGSRPRARRVPASLCSPLLRRNSQLRNDLVRGAGVKTRVLLPQLPAANRELPDTLRSANALVHPRWPFSLSFSSAAGKDGTRLLPCASRRFLHSLTRLLRDPESHCEGPRGGSRQTPRGDDAADCRSF